MEMENVSDVYPLSPIQAGMLFHSVVAPNSSMYVGQIQFTLDGALDPDRFRSIWHDLLARHDMLRTAFFWDGLNEPLQVVRQQVGLPLDFVDLSNEPGWEARLDHLVDARRNAGFDLQQAPLIHLLLVRLAPHRHRVVWTCHHMLMDGWSVTAILAEWFERYAAVASGQNYDPAPTPTYHAFVDWLAHRDTTSDATFWRSYLAGVDGPTGFDPAGDSGTAGATGSPEHRHCNLALSPALSARLDALARAQRITPATLVHGAYALLVSLYADSGDVVFGTTVSGRPQALAGVEHAVGLYINTLPVRVQLTDDQPLGDWLRALQQNLIAGREHEHSALFDVQKYSGLPSGTALFDHILVFQNYPAPELNGLVDGLSVSDYRVDAPSNYPLAMLVTPGDRMSLHLVYNPARYDTDFAQTLLRRFACLLESIPASLEDPPSRLHGLDDDEAERVLVAWNRTETPLPNVDSVLDLIVEQARQHPDSIAVDDGTRRLTYAELVGHADAWARSLRVAGADADAPVTICIERGVDLIVGLVAVLRAGAAYLPLDPNYPAARSEDALADAGVRLLLTDRASSGRFAAAGIETLSIDTAPAENDGELPSPKASDTAYLIYTSGSTGRPKGVRISHRNLLASTAARYDYYGAPPAAFLLLSSVAFDSSVAGIFWTLTGGGRLIVAAHRAEQDIASLADNIAGGGVTHTLCLPSLYRTLLDQAPLPALAGLQCVIVAGEPVPASLPTLHRERVPATRLYNEYGPTEATVWCSVAELTGTSDAEVPPIGTPIANTRIYLLDRLGRPVPPGLPGEIHVAGLGLSDGYLNRPEDTAERFVTRRLGDRVERLYRTGDLARLTGDDQLVFLGRIDRQLKIRGHRIEPGEVEAALQQLTGVQEAVVVVDGTGAQRLVAYVIAPPRTGVLDTAALRDALHGRLPTPMVPAQVLQVDGFPRLPNGKIDVDALGRRDLSDATAPAPDAAPIAPRTPIERTLAAIWCDLLRRDAVGIHDDFFALGGDSILSITFVSRASQEGLKFSPNDIFNFPTIAGLAGRAGDPAAAIPANGADAAGTAPAEASSADARTTTGSRRPTFLIHIGGDIAVHMRERLGTEQPVYLLEGHWTHAGLDRGVTIPQMAAENVAELRTLQSAGPYLLVGFSMGAPVALEMARQLHSEGEIVDPLILVEPPDRIEGPVPLPEDASPQTPPDSEAPTGIGKLKRWLRPLIRFCRLRLYRPTIAVLAGGCRQLGMPVPQPWRKIYVSAVYRDAWDAYEPGGYSGALTLYRASAHRNAGAGVWERLGDADVTREWFDGGHFDFMHDPDVQCHLVEELAARIETATRQKN